MSSQGHEDNFGFYDLDFPLEAEFLEHIRRRSRPVHCDNCDRIVSLLPDHHYCAVCTFNFEMGWEQPKKKIKGHH